MRRDAGCWVRGRRRRTLGEDINPRSGPSDGVARAEWESTFSKRSNIHGAPTKARGFHRGPREAKSCRDYDFSRASISCLVRSRISRILAILAESWLARVAAFNAVFMRSAAGRITS